MNGNIRGCGGQKITIVIFNYKQRLLSIDMKTKVVQHVPRIIFSKFSNLQVFRFSSFQSFQVFNNIPGSQVLSDFQTFFSKLKAYKVI